MFSYIETLFKPKQQNSFDDIKTIPSPNKIIDNVIVEKPLKIKKKKTIHFKLKANPLEVHTISQFK
tara:strand:+ start:427 stop:624 length:198 start_codon:yes stop_codon:yes gene_type:complete